MTGLVGAHILGEGAPDVIHEAQALRTLKRPLHKLHSMTHAYPTYAQALVGRASQLAYLDRMTGSFFVKTALRLLPGCADRLGLARERLAETKTPPHDGMQRSNLVVETEPVEDAGVCVLRLPEELADHDEAPILAAVAGAPAKKPDQIILNFENVRRMNGLGASMLVKLDAVTGMRGQSLNAFGLGQGLRDVFRVTGLDQAIGIHESRTDALSSVRSDAGRVSSEGGSRTGDFDSRNWARPVKELRASHRPREARCLNVNGRRATGPLNGFGQLWQKIYRIVLSDNTITPEQAVSAMKQNFTAFQPWYNRFFPSPAGIRPGEIVLFDSWTPGGPVSTGVMILFADDLSFTFITPEGHPECGIVSFSAYRAEGRTVAQILGLARASDPVYEGGFRLIGSRLQGRIWTHVLTALATYLGVPAHVTVDATCIDTRLHWSRALNIRHNAQIRTLLREPLWWLAVPLRARGGKETGPA